MFQRSIIIALCLFVTQAFAVTAKSPEEARDYLLKFLDYKSPVKLKIEPLPEPGSLQEKFLELYKEKFFPNMIARDEAYVHYRALHELLGGGLYRDETEKRAWTEKAEQIANWLDSFATSKEWQNLELKWASLAEGLTGDLPEIAREGAEKIKESALPMEAQALLERETALSLEISEKINQLPSNLEMQNALSLRKKIIADFFAQRTSFEQALEKLKELRSKSDSHHGQKVAQNVGSLINEQARLASKLAKLRGSRFRTHADYALSLSQKGHGSGFQSKEDLLKLLYKILDDTNEVAQKYYRTMATYQNIDLQKLNKEALQLVGAPTYLLMSPFFPQGNMMNLWHQTMRDSGFSEDELQSVMVDAYPRENKSSGAHLNSILSPDPEILHIDGRTFQLKNLGRWIPGRNFISQNLNDDGLGPLNTAFHEGGHALDFLNRRSVLPTLFSYAYSETHSTTMESFLTDKEYLLENGRGRMGERPSPERVDLYLKRRAAADLLSLRETTMVAIIDLEVWDYDYDSGNEAFVDRLFAIAKKLANYISPIPLTPSELDHFAYSFLSSDHLHQGGVIYYGYVLAEVSAALMTNALLDKLEASTGRRTLNRQPKLAEILTKGIYEAGHTVPFPQSIEKFSGKKFSVEDFTSLQKQALEEYIADLRLEEQNKDCGGFLK